MILSMFILSFIFVIVCGLLNGNESDIFFFIVLLYVSLISFVYMCQGFPTSHVYFVLNELRREVIIHVVDVGGIVDHRC
jgi:hypothetical protein